MCKKLLEIQKKHVVDNFYRMCAIRDKADAVRTLHVEIEQGKNLVTLAMTDFANIADVIGSTVMVKKQSAAH